VCLLFHHRDKFVAGNPDLILLLVWTLKEQFILFVVFKGSGKFPMSTGIIYVIRNRQSSKEFVGATTQKLSGIWTAHKSWTRGGRLTPLHNEMHRFGHHNFLIREVETVPVNQLRSKQKEWINRLKTIVPCGYNRNTENSGHRMYFDRNDVKRIRKLSKTTDQYSIARTYGVSQATISKIITRKIYK
jgi:hypothetical protein